MLSGTVESVIDGTAAVASDKGARYAIPVGELRPVRGASLYGSIRRDRIAVDKVSPGARPNGGLNSVVGEVHTLENQGSYVKVTIDLGDNAEEFVAHVPDEAFFRNPLDIGDRVEARWSASDINLLDDGAAARASASPSPVAASASAS